MGEGKKKKKRSLCLILCNTIALWCFDWRWISWKWRHFSEFPPADCMPVGQHCPAHLNGIRRISTSALLSLSQRNILPLKACGGSQWIVLLAISAILKLKGKKSLCLYAKWNGPFTLELLIGHSQIGFYYVRCLYRYWTLNGISGRRWFRGHDKDMRVGLKQAGVLWPFWGVDCYFLFVFMDAAFSISFGFDRGLPQRMWPSPFSVMCFWPLGAGTCDRQVMSNRMIKGTSKETNGRLWSFPTRKSIGYQHAATKMWVCNVSVYHSSLPSAP